MSARGLALLLAVVAGAGCAPPMGAAAAPPSGLASAIATRDTGRGGPPLTAIVREGDARGALAVAVTTVGIAPARGAMVGVALAALTQERLAKKGVESVAVGGWNGWRLRALVASPVEASRFAEALRAALLTPVTADDPALAAVARKASALAARPLADHALADVAQCTGEAFGNGNDAAPSAAELESWRASAHALGRLAIATAGDDALATATAHALAEAPAWPHAAAIAPAFLAPPADAGVVVYDASGAMAPGGARIFVTARTTTAERAVAAASLLGDLRGPLASRLAALESPARLRSVVATAQRDGGCLAATIDLAAHDLGADAPARIATAAALARQELAVEVTDTTAAPDFGAALATRASDPRDAAERAAWWSLAGHRAGAPDADVRVHLVVGVATTRDASEVEAGARAESIRNELDRATLAWHARIVDARTRVERGQGDVWVLVASPCGTAAESPGDAGAGAAIARAAATQAASGAGDAQAEPFVATDGVGVLVHGPRRPDETPQAQARRLADMAARAFAADALEPEPLSQARSALLLQASRDDEPVRGALASVLAPGHPSWVEPTGTGFGLASVSDATLAVRAGAVRAGPLRVAVVANVDASQAEAAVRAADRWVARRPDESRVCPPTAIPSGVRPGTYAFERPLGGASEALLALPLAAPLALPLAPADPGAQAATWLASALDGADGLLARALGAETASPLAEAWSAGVVGAPRAPALVVRIAAADDSLDAAVAQVRALLGRLGQGALRDEDLTRATARIGRATLAASLDPRARAIALWRGETAAPPPSLTLLRTFAATVLHDESLVIVAARPPRIAKVTHVQGDASPAAHDAKLKP